MASQKAARAAEVALGLIDGKTAAQACVDAGYSKQTAENHAYAIIRHKDVRNKLIEYGSSIARSDLGNAAKARLMDMLNDNSLDVKVLVPAIRTALEVSGEIGARSELIHKHTVEIPASVLDIISAKVDELQRKRELTVDSSVIDVPVGDGGI
jgi:hypothetical protein